MSSQQGDQHAGEPVPDQTEQAYPAVPDLVQDVYHPEAEVEGDVDQPDDKEAVEEAAKEDAATGAPAALEVDDQVEPLWPDKALFDGTDIQGRPLPYLQLVGPQEIPIEEIHPDYVLSGKVEDVMTWMKPALGKTTNYDRTYNGFAPGSPEFARFEEAMRSRVQASLTSMTDDDSVEEGVGFQCDFTGVQCILGGARGPLSPSIEAPNAFGWVVQPDGTRSLLYHAPFTGGEDQVNLGVVAWCLNWVHGHHPIAVMPFVGRILRAMTDFEDPASQRREIELCFVGFANVTVVQTITGNSQRHDIRHQMASLDEHNATLDALRTADRSPYVIDRLDLFTDRQLFRFKKFEACHQTPNKLSPATSFLYGKLFSWCKAISEEYGLTDQEFLELCCIKAPAPSEGFVFFPFYHLARPKAEKQGWTWDSCRQFFVGRHERMMKACAKHSRDAGFLLNETWVSLLLAIAHHWCDMVRRAKKRASQAGIEQDHIKWLVLDCIDVPVVWWLNSLLTASINKRVHGMVMGLGWDTSNDVRGTIQPRHEQPGFDAVKSFDMTRSNISWDSQLMNQLVQNYSRHTWADCRRLAAAIPWSRPQFWNVDEGQHREIWESSRSEPVKFQGKKSSIERVLASRKASTLETSTRGDAVPQGPPQEVPTSPTDWFAGDDTSRSDQTYWATAFAHLCGGCGRHFSQKSSLTQHRKNVCKFCVNVKCSRKFDTARDRLVHEAPCAGIDERPNESPVKQAKKKQKTSTGAEPTTTQSTSFSPLAHKKPAAQDSPTKTSAQAPHSTKLDASDENSALGASSAGPPLPAYLGPLPAPTLGSLSAHLGPLPAPSFGPLPVPPSDGASDDVFTPAHRAVQTAALAAAQYIASFLPSETPLATSSAICTNTYIAARDAGFASLAQVPAVDPATSSPAATSTTPSPASSPPAATPTTPSSASASLRQDGLTPFPSRQESYHIPVDFADRPEWLASMDEVESLFSGLHYDGPHSDLGSTLDAQERRWWPLVRARYNMEGRLARRDWLEGEDLDSQIFEIFRDVRTDHMIYEEEAGRLLALGVDFTDAFNREVYPDLRFGRNEYYLARRVAFSVNTRYLFPGSGEGDHWFVAIYDQTTARLVIADSLPVKEDSERYLETRRRVMRYLAFLGRADPEPTLVMRNVPQQRDGASCGLHLLSNLAAMVRGGTHHEDDMFRLWTRRVRDELGQDSPTRATPSISTNFGNWVNPKPNEDSKEEPEEPAAEKPQDVEEPAVEKPQDPEEPAAEKPKYKQTTLDFGKAAAAPSIHPPPSSPQNAPSSDKVACEICAGLYKPKGLITHMNAKHPKCKFCNFRATTKLGMDLILHEEDYHGGVTISGENEEVADGQDEEVEDMDVADDQDVGKDQEIADSEDEEVEYMDVA
ncbi:hypothetical protein LQW54_005794 [Pestalotiopsis sp. IQ-011]